MKNETKIISLLLEHGERLVNHGMRLDSLEEKIEHVVSGNDKIVTILERMDTDRYATASRMDRMQVDFDSTIEKVGEHEVSLGSLKQKIELL